jgi:hypothetical protein
MHFWIISSEDFNLAKAGGLSKWPQNFSRRTFCFVEEILQGSISPRLWRKAQMHWHKEFVPKYVIQNKVV